MAEKDDESSDWEDSSEEEPVKETVQKSKKPATKTRGAEPKMANEDADSMDDWEDSDSEPKPIEKKDPTKSAPKAPTKKNAWEDDESDDDAVEESHQPKARSQNKNKLRRERLRQREMNNSKRAKREEYSSDDSDEEDGGNDTIQERNKHNVQGNHMLFGDEKVQRKKKAPQKKRKTTLRDLYPINRESRLEAKKDLNKFADAISQYMLDLSIGGVDQNKKAVKPAISPNMTKTFVCKIIAKCCDSLDLTQLADIRRQADSQMTMYRNKELKSRQAKRRGDKVRTKAQRVIHVEESTDPVYVDGSYNDTDFDAFF